MFKRRVCYLFSLPLSIQDLPLRCVVTSLSQAPVRAAGENGRKSDPYGGPIKLTTDLQSSSKPGQGFITSPDWHPPLTPAHCALNLSLPPQQHWYLNKDLHSCFFIKRWVHPQALIKMEKVFLLIVFWELVKTHCCCCLRYEDTGAGCSLPFTGGNLVSEQP